MEAALVSASTGVLKPLLFKLTKLLSDKYVKLKWVRRQIKFLRDELSTMNATLQMLADAEELNPQMRDWRDKVRELAYDIEDCIDSFMAKVDHNEHRRPMGFNLLRQLNKLKARHKICKEIQELKARAAEVSERHKRYNFFQGTHIYSTSGIDPRLPALYEEVDRLVGINSPKNHIIERLFAREEDSSSAKLRVISIVGCGGLGKTTLANQVYHAVKRRFRWAALVSVSRNPNMKRILRDIAKGLGITDYRLDDDEHQLISILRGHLQQERYFVVIDDIWDEKAWEIIKLALVNNNCGSRIITTSRNVTVASCCSSGGGYVYQMQPLSFDDSKRLCFRRAFGHENFYCPHLGDVPDQILRKCGGLPLAVITVSSMLTDQHTRDEWDRVLNAIGSALAKNPGAENMTTILSMSYFDLPHHLKTCLLYLSAFPEDHKIGKQRLINRWTAEGFIQEEQGLSAYDIGEHYFNDLINRSLIQPVAVKYGNAQACQVHDIILDFITCKATEENFISSLDTVRNGNFSDYQFRRLSVFASWPLLDIVTDSTALNLILSKVRSLTIFGHPVQTSLLAFTALRVLDLENCWELKNEHLSNIEKLFHLKYLCMSSHLITCLPGKIGELQYLETLDIRGTMIQEFPTTIVKLQRLTHLYIGSRVIFQEGMIGQMKSLEVLEEFGIHSLQGAEYLQEFSQLVKLRTLVISWKLYCSFELEGSSNLIVDPQSYVRTLICTSNIRNLYINDYHDEFPWFRALSMDSWSPTARCSLQKLHITYCSINKVPKWLSSLGNLKELELHIYCTRPEDLEILGAIPSLLCLELVTLCGTNGRITFRGTKGFRNLKSFSLYIVNCGTALEMETGSMPKLEHLKLMFCVHKMECLNGASTFGILHLSALTKVEVVIRGNCSNYFHSVENMKDCIVKSVASTIRDVVQTHPNSPTISFQTDDDSNYCRHFKLCLERINKRFGVPTDWLGKYQIEEAHSKPVRSREAEREDHDASRLNMLDEINEDEEEQRERYWQEQLEAWMDTESVYDYWSESANEIHT